MKLIGIVFSSIMMTGCVSNAISTLQPNGGEILGYSGAQYFGEIQARANQSCNGRNLGLARIVSTRSAAFDNNIYQFVCYVPETKASPIEKLDRSNQQIQEHRSSSFSFEDAKRKCLDLGVKTGTEQFGKCVLQLSK
jgi:hypothetical protein